MANASNVLHEVARFDLSEDISPKYIMAFVAAIQAYKHDAYRKRRSANLVYRKNTELQLEMQVVTQNSSYFELLNWVFDNDKDIQVILASTELRLAKEVSMHKVLSQQTVLDICAHTKKPFAQVVGICIGSESSTLVNLPQKQTQTTQRKALVDIQLPSEVFRTIADLAKEHKIAVATMPEEMCSVSSIGELQYGVYGLQSFATYAGSCCKVPVLEFVHTDDMPLTKWSNPFYQIANLRELQTERLRMYLKQFWEKGAFLPANRSKQQSAIDQVFRSV